MSTYFDPHNHNDIVDNIYKMTEQKPKYPL